MLDGNGWDVGIEDGSIDCFDFYFLVVWENGWGFLCFVYVCFGLCVFEFGFFGFV